MRRTRLAAWSILVLGALALLSGCFGPGGSSQPVEDAGTDAAFGAGGFGGFAGGVPALDAGRPVDQPPVACGGVMCPTIGPAASLGVQTCCSPSGQCSLTLMANACQDLAEPDPRCGMIAVGDGELPGCCMADMLCGANVEMLGIGCISVDMLASLGIKAELRPCADVDVSDDAGVEP